MNNTKLLDSIFKISQDKGKEYLLYLDPDRLLAPCYEAIGQKPQKPRYGGWEEKQISGHSLGHYISALSQMYIVDNDKAIKEKLDYTISELAHIQSFDNEGYVSGFQKECFNKVFSGNFNVTRFELGDSWVPWYSIHKIYAGLIDAYELAGDKKALNIVIKLAQWAKNGTDNLNDEEFQKMLYCEHGGMCEVLAKLYKITKNPDHLNLAIRFLHHETFNPILKLQDELEGKHANTQIPKVIGAAILYELTGNENYKNAVEFFWNTVTKKRSYVIGGNSINEHFEKICSETLSVTTAETCNTYNMLKLTEYLYKWNHKSEYMDYYETALYNHILPSQDTETGMKTYFMSTKPGHFKVYCTPDNSFWCCTGTGMENPTRYTRNIYYKDTNSLFVNLFISSQLILEEDGMIISQITDFPSSEDVKLLIDKADNIALTIYIRIPAWINNPIILKVNGITYLAQSNDNYISINRKWNTGDVIDIKLPMKLNLYKSKGNKNEIAFIYGPIVLAGALGRENYPETDILDDHLKLNYHQCIDVPLIIGNDDEILKNVGKNNDLTFEINALSTDNSTNIKLIPFYNLNHQRYTLYWNRVNKSDINSNNIRSKSQDKIQIIDEIHPHEQQSEIEHKLKYKNSTSDYSKEFGQGWRECKNNGYFSYEINLSNEDEDQKLIITYCENNLDSTEVINNYRRGFNIFIDDVLLSEEIQPPHEVVQLYEIKYSLPKILIKDKKKITVKFQSYDNCSTGKVFGLKLSLL